MKKIAITGLSGIIGSRFCKYLPEGYKIYDLYHQTPVKLGTVINRQIDLINQENIHLVLEEINPDIIIHMASVTHIDRCEEDRKNGKNGIVWKTNVSPINIIADFCRKNKTNLIFLSTECVFDGEKDEYDEEDIRNPKNWYGFTKSKAEEIILIKCPNQAAIIRAVITYYENDQGKTILGKFLELLRSKKEIFAVTDQIISPTYTDDILAVIKILLADFQAGIFHVSSGSRITPMEFGQKITRKFGLDESLIRGKSLEEYFGKEKARLRLKNSYLNDAKTRLRLKYNPLTVEEALNRIDV